MVTTTGTVEAIVMGAVTAECVAPQAPEATASGSSNGAGVVTAITTLTANPLIIDSFEHGGEEGASLAVVKPIQTQLFAINSATAATSSGGASWGIGDAAGAHSLEWTSASNNSLAHAVAAFSKSGLTLVTLNDALSALVSTQYTDQAVINGITNGTAITISGGNADIRNVTQTSAWGTLITANNNDTIEVRMTSNAATNKQETATVNVGAGGSVFVWHVDTGGASWVIAGDNATINISANGVVWTELDVSAVFGANNLGSVAWGQGKWMMTGGTTLATSTDGTNWTAVDATAAIPATHSLRGIHYSEEEGLWMLGSFKDSFNAFIATSPDGVTWTYKANIIPQVNETYPQQLHYARGVWVASRWGSAAASMSSDSGVTWTEIRVYSIGGANAVYANGIWLKPNSVESGSPTNSSRYSSDDGVTWTAVDYGGGNYAQYQATYGNDKFLIAQISSGTPDKIQEFTTASPPVMTTRATSPAAGLSTGAVGFGDGLWVVSRDATPDKLMTTSLDFSLNMAWSIRANPTQPMKFAAYGGTHNTPNAFTLTNQTGVALSTPINSNIVTVNNFTGPLKVFSGNGAQVCVNDTDSDLSNGCSTGFVAGNGTASVSPGDTVGFQLTSSGSNNTETISTIQIGARIYHWSIKTLL